MAAVGEVATEGRNHSANSHKLGERERVRIQCLLYFNMVLSNNKNITVQEISKLVEVGAI